MDFPKYGLDFNPDLPKNGKKMRVVKRATPAAIELMHSMPKVDWQRIKHMSKLEMCTYVQAVYNKGFRDGVASQQRPKATKTPIEKPAEEPPAADPGGEPDELGD